MWKLCSKHITLSWLTFGNLGDKIQVEVIQVDIHLLAGFTACLLHFRSKHELFTLFYIWWNVTHVNLSILIAHLLHRLLYFRFTGGDNTQQLFVLRVLHMQGTFNKPNLGTNLNYLRNAGSLQKTWAKYVRTRLRDHITTSASSQPSTQFLLEQNQAILTYSLRVSGTAILSSWALS